MTNEMVSATPGGVNASAAGYGHGREANGTACPATIIDRTWTGRYELQLLRLPCAAHEHGKRCPHPATTVIGVAGFVQDRDDERRGAMFCAVHGQERLRAMEPVRIAEVAS